MREALVNRFAWFSLLCICGLMDDGILVIPAAYLSAVSIQKFINIKQKFKEVLYLSIPVTFMFISFQFFSSALWQIAKSTSQNDISEDLHIASILFFIGTTILLQFFYNCIMSSKK
jgi:hypothetical protein